MLSAAGEEGLASRPSLQAGSSSCDRSHTEELGVAEERAAVQWKTDRGRSLSGRPAERRGQGEGLAAAQNRSPVPSRTLAAGTVGAPCFRSTSVGESTCVGPAQPPNRSFAPSWPPRPERLSAAPQAARRPRRYLLNK